MSEEDIELLDAYGWVVVCEIPLELEDKSDATSTATGSAVDVILSWCKQMEKT